MEEGVIKEYLLDTYKFGCEGRIIEMEQQGDSWKIKLDRTVFHPQGGGQPSDKGTLKQGDITFTVESVETDKADGSPLHIGKFSSDSVFNSEVVVEGQIDEEYRRLNARLHSAGHLLDVAVAQLGYQLVPGKGYHFSPGAYVEYAGNIPNEQRNDALQRINEIMIQLIASTQESVNVNVYEYEEAKQHIEVPGYLPEGRPIRVVKLSNQDNGCPCGGTHVKHVSEIGGVVATKIQKKGKNLRLSYNLA